MLMAANPGVISSRSGQTTRPATRRARSSRADVFTAGERADVVGVSKGKGFAGVMKRHGFGGLGASHGTEKKHRSPGSIGACATPSRVFKGMRMAGQHREPTGDHPEPRGRTGRSGTQPAPGQGRGPRSHRRSRDGPVGREGTAREWGVMAKIDITDATGKKSGSRELPDEIFASGVNVPLMHQVVVAGLSGLRSGSHSTKTRGEVSGGGKKPWRQKGTGRSPPRLDPLAAVGRRRGLARSSASLARDARQQEDEAWSPPVGADRRAAERQARGGRSSVVRRARGRVRPSPSFAHSAWRARCWWFCPSREEVMRGEVVPEPPRGARHVRAEPGGPTTCCAPIGSCSRRRRSTSWKVSRRSPPRLPRTRRLAREVSSRRHHPPGRVREVLRRARAEHVHLPRRQAGEQNGDQGGRPDDLGCPRDLCEHLESPRQGEAPGLDEGWRGRREARDRHALAAGDSIEIFELGK